MSAPTTFADLNLHTIAPEISLLVLLAVVLLIEVFSRSQATRLMHLITVVGLVVIGVWQAVASASLVPTVGMNGLTVIDPMGALLKSGAAFATAGCLVYSREYLQQQRMGFGEFHLFALFAALGQFIMISGNHLLTIYLGIELLSLALYSAVALRRDSVVSVEAAMKYFVLGALASGFLLYGMSMIYGATGSLDLATIADKVSSGGAEQLVMVFGTVFLVAGLAFKLGVVPFHMWVPDVYQGAPTATTLLIGAAPKFAAFAITIRLLVSGLLGVAADWQQMLLVLCVLSLVVGNFVALVQTDLKRILAYSTIAHMGFMLLAIASGVVGDQAGGAVDAYASSLFYVFIYALTTLGSFGVLLLASRQGYELASLDDLKGLSQSRPMLAWVMLVLVFSLAGIPPTAGFYAKLAVLESAVAAGYVGLAVFAVMASLIGAFYYLRMVKVMFFDPPAEPDPDARPEGVADLPSGEGEAPVRPSGAAANPLCPVQSSVLSVNGLAVLALGILPGPLMAYCVYAVKASLAA
jgi:NADH-quinone oxidoreductase subunit N